MCTNLHIIVYLVQIFYIALTAKMSMSLRTPPEGVSYTSILNIPLKFLNVSIQTQSSLSQTDTLDILCSSIKNK